MGMWNGGNYSKKRMVIPWNFCSFFGICLRLNFRNSTITIAEEASLFFKNYQMLKFRLS